MSSSTVSLRLDTIQTHPLLQLRDHINEEKVETFAEIYGDDREPEGDPPVVFQVNEDGQGKTGYWLVDGHHRKKGSEKAEKKRMKCEVKEGTFEQAVEYANREANSKHGQELSKKAITRKITWHLEHPKYQYFTDKQIALWTRTTRQYVQKIRANVPEPKYPEECPVELCENEKKNWTKLVLAGHKPRLTIEAMVIRVIDAGELSPLTGHVPTSQDFDLDTTQEQKEKKERKKKTKVASVEFEHEIADKFGNVVPERLRDQFRDSNLAKVDEYIEMLLDAEKLAVEIANSPIGTRYKPRAIRQDQPALKHLSPSQYLPEIRDAITIAREQTPYCICPGCVLLLKKDSQGCAYCDGFGWITKSIFDYRLSSEQRKAIEDGKYNELIAEVGED